jgi:hypothetical protein
MTKLSDTQAVILSAASQRDDGAVLPLPKALAIKGGAVDKVLGSLKAKGLIDHQGAPRGDDPPPLRITRAGLRAIGVQTEDDASEGATRSDTGATSADAGAPATAGRAATPAKRKATAAKRGKAVPAEKPTLRAGTKQAQMIDLLKRPKGATVEQIAAVTGWQHHTIRGAISGALKKKLGLTVEATRTREVGPNKAGASGGSGTSSSASSLAASPSASASRRSSSVASNPIRSRSKRSSRSHASSSASSTSSQPACRAIWLSART